MADIRIQGGCALQANGTWLYAYNDKEGEHLVFFESATVPKIGDLIVGGVNQPLTEPLSNQDHSRWIKNPPDVWPDKGF